MKNTFKKIIYPICIVLGFFSLLFKTHLFFGGDYLSSKNIFITLFLLLVVIVFLIVGTILNRRR